MLRDRHRQLLTAYVDGELNERQQKLVLRLLDRSSEARALVKLLKDSSDKLKALPRQRLAPDFAQKVLDEIDQRQLRHAARPRPVKGIPVWAGLSAAAALLIAVGGGAFWYFLASHRTDQGIVASGSPDKAGDGQKEQNPPAGEPTLANAASPDHRSPEVGTHREPTPVAKGPMDRPGREPEPTRTDRNQSVLGDARRNDGAMFIQPASEKILGLATFLNIRELDQAKLLDELQRDPAFRLELPCKDGNKAWQRLKGALGGNRIGVVLDPMAQAQVKSRDPRVSYVLYLDDLTPQEWVELLKRVGDADRNAENTRRGSGQFHSLFVSRMTEYDRKEFSDLLGSLSTSAPRAEPTKAVSEHRSLLVPYPYRPSSKPAELKQFFDNQPSPRPGALQVILVLRGPEG